MLMEMLLMVVVVVAMGVVAGVCAIYILEDGDKESLQDLESSGLLAHQVHCTDQEGQPDVPGREEELLSLVILTELKIVQNLRFVPGRQQSMTDLRASILIQEVFFSSGTGSSMSGWFSKSPAARAFFQMGDSGRKTP